MKAYYFLKEKNLVVSEKDFMELYFLRSIMCDDVFLNDPNADLSKINKIKIGIKEIILK